jgi:DNA polymerase-3 subunit epsilon
MKKLYIDIETTGLITYQARICQIGLIWETDDFTDEKSILINPTIIIPENATKIHKITNEMVHNAQTFCDISLKLKSLFDKADCVIAYNGVNYDIPILKYEFLRCGIDLEFNNIVDPYLVWNKMEKKKLKDAYKRFVGEELDGAHDALIDIQATKKVLENMCKIYNCKIEDLINL